MNLSLRDAISDLSRYVAKNPSMLLRLLSHAAALRLAVPLDALRWLATELLTGDKAPTDVTIEAQARGLHLKGQTVFMGNPMRAGATVTVKSITVAPGVLTTTVRITDLTMEALSEPSPMSQLLASGVLNLSKPGSLLKFMGKAPAVLVDSTDDEFVLDLLQLPELRDNIRLMKALEALTPVFHVQDIFTEDDLLLIAFKATPSGVPQLVAALRELVATSL